MALLTLADLVTDCQFEIPGKEQATIVLAANKVIRRIQADYVEPAWTTFTTKVALTTGTVSVTQDLAAVTFSGSILSAADPVMLIYIEGEVSPFVMTYASGVGGILSSKWAAATNGTATFSILYPTVSFPFAVGEVLEIRRGDYKLQFHVGIQCPSQAGLPSRWGPYVHDETGTAPNDELTRTWLDPAPNTRVVYLVQYKPRTTFLTPGGATTQTIPFQTLWYDAIVQGCLYYLWKQERRNKEDVLVQKSLYEEAMTRARGSQHPAASVQSRRGRRWGLSAYEERPIAGE
jgi:hypothetical protein